MVGRSFDPVRPTTEVDGIQIPFENLVFAEFLFQFDRVSSLTDLAIKFLGSGQQVDLHELLGDCRPALFDLTGVQVLQHRSARGLHVDALVSVERCVFYVEDCVDQVFWHPVQRHRSAVLLAAKHRDLLPAGIKHHGAFF